MKVIINALQGFRASRTSKLACDVTSFTIDGIKRANLLALHSLSVPHFAVEPIRL
jgi:hypothetical protein